MPKQYQSGKLEIRDDVKRPYYIVRASVPKRMKDGKLKNVRVQFKIGFTDELSVKDAKVIRSQILERVNAGRFVAQSQITFGELVERFEQIRLPQLGIATQAQYKSQLQNHLVPAFGNQKLCEMDRPAIEEFLTVKAESLGWWARNNLRSILSALFRAAKDWKLWDDDVPTTGVRIGKKRFKREKKLLTVEQMRRLLAALQDHLKFLVLILFGLGLRISEALALKWADFDLDAGTVQIRRRWYRGDLSEETRTESSTAELRLSASMLAEVKLRYPGPHKRPCFLLVGDDGLTPPDDRDLLRFEFRPILKRLALYYEGFGWHAFRRQNITWRQQVGGATLPEAQKAARHASLDMTYLYMLTDAERETQQQQAMFDYLLGTAEGPKM